MEEKTSTATEVINGFQDITFSSWRGAFDDLYERMLNYRECIWRGQRCDDWLLESTLARLKKKTKHAGISIPILGDHLERFKYAIRGRRGPSPPLLEKDNDLWALGQHYGLASPLLDWTESPFVAAYFAFIDTGERQTDFRAVYCLHRPSVEKKAKQLLAEKRSKWQNNEQGPISEKYVTNALAGLLTEPTNPEVEFVRPLSDENQRLVNQAGLFTRFPLTTDVQSWVQSNFEGKNGDLILQRIRIPNKDREDCLKALNRMNINPLTLFPDLHGASRFCNLSCEIENY